MAGTARQVHLGRQLRELRTQAALSLEEAATRIERSRATVGHWERGHAKVSARDLDALLQLYKAPGEMAEQLRQLRRESGQRGWWQSYKLPAYMMPFLGFEAEASEVFAFELGVIPGLLQTEPYARAVHEVGRLSLSGEEMQGWVDARLRRQERLSQNDGLSLHCVIAEEALHRNMLPDEQMSQQVTHLAAVAAWPNVSVQVLPLHAGAHVGMHGPFTVLRFADPTHADVAFRDDPLGGHLIDDPRDVPELTRLFSELQTQALPAKESARLLSSLSEAHGAGSQRRQT